MLFYLALWVWYTDAMCCSQPHCQTSLQLSDCMGSEDFRVPALWCFHSASCFHPKLLRFVCFSPSSLNYVFHFFLYSLHPASVQRCHHPLSQCAAFLPLNRLQCCSPVLLPGGSCQPATATALIYACVCVGACVWVTWRCSQPPEGPLWHREPCIIVHQLYTKLMTRGYVGQARMMQQTCTEGSWLTMGDRGRLRRLEAVNKKHKNSQWKCSRRRTGGRAKPEGGENRVEEDGGSSWC